mgnify:CR=1 FL=1
MDNAYIEGLRKDVKRALKSDKMRFRHTIGVADTSACLASRYGVDMQKAYISGLLHDCAKCVPDEQKIAECEQNNIDITESEYNSPYLLHSKLGAFYADVKYGIKDNDIEAKFQELGINCISDQDMITPKKSSRKFGLYINDDGMVKHLAMPVWHWGAFYEKLIQSILSGSWKKEEEGDKVSALNYWWGMSSGAVDIIYGGGLNSETRKIVDLVRHSIIKGEFMPFSGELKNQAGEIMNKADETLDPDEVIEMDWLLDNVVGKVPEYDELSDDSKLLVMNQGIIDVNE